MKKLILNSIRFYQSYLSPDRFSIHSCRYSPTCSEYSYQAILKYGILKGSLMGLYRVIRCNPFSKGGIDPLK